MYSIIEDFSPYYIRFTWPNLSETIDFIKNQPLNENDNDRWATWPTSYKHYNYDLETSTNILKLLPMKDQLTFNMKRFGLFITPPGKKSSIHKDGMNHRISINIPIVIADDKCITSWYSDESFKNVQPKNGKNARQMLYPDEDYSVHQPEKSIVVKPNECILFNTEIYHMFDNTNSTNERRVLTLRLADTGNIYFEDVKKILFL